MPHKKKEPFTQELDIMLGSILSRENFILALKRVERNKGSHGVDEIHVQNLRAHIMEHWASIRGQLEGGTYYPQLVRRVEIPKPNGGMRKLGIPTVLDRFLQQAIAQVLTTIYDPTFSEHSYSFRPNRRGHDAVRKARSYIKDGYRWVIDMDLEKFFDKVHHDRLMRTLSQKIKDPRVLKLIPNETTVYGTVYTGGVRGEKSYLAFPSTRFARVC